MRALTVALTMAVLATPAAAEPVSLYVAGSLRGALTDTAKAFEAASGNTVQVKFGASGLLKDEIIGGAKVDVFASANIWSIRKRSQRQGKAGRRCCLRATSCAR
jgi:molybdate transport system substrate-binding protein